MKKKRFMKATILPGLGTSVTYGFGTPDCNSRISIINARGLTTLTAMTFSAGPAEAPKTRVLNQERLAALPPAEVLHYLYSQLTEFYRFCTREA